MRARVYVRVCVYVSVSERTRVQKRKSDLSESVLNVSEMHVQGLQK